MFKGSGQINPQGLKNDYSGFERAAAIKQQTLAGVGRAIKEGHEKIVKKKKDAAAVESSRVLMKKVADAAGFELDAETLAAIAKGADPEFMNTATETMAKLGQWDREQKALKEKQIADRAVSQQLADLVKRGQDVNVSEGGLDRGSREEINAAGLASVGTEGKLNRGHSATQGDANRAVTTAGQVSQAKTAKANTEATIRGQDKTFDARMAGIVSSETMANVSDATTRRGQDLNAKSNRLQRKLQLAIADGKKNEFQKILEMAQIEEGTPEYINASRTWIESYVNGDISDLDLIKALRPGLELPDNTGGKFTIPRISPQGQPPVPQPPVPPPAGGQGGQGGQNGPTRKRNFFPGSGG